MFIYENQVDATLVVSHPPQVKGMEKSEKLFSTFSPQRTAHLRN